MMYNYGYYYSPFDFLGSLIGWFIIVFIIIWLIKASKRDRFFDRIHRHGFGRDTAMDLLRERYVKGEISKEEFETKKKDLMN